MSSSFFLLSSLTHGSKVRREEREEEEEEEREEEEEERALFLNCIQTTNIVLIHRLYGNHISYLLISRTEPVHSPFHFYQFLSHNFGFEFVLGSFFSSCFFFFFFLFFPRGIKPVGSITIPNRCMLYAWQSWCKLNAAVIPCCLPAASSAWLTASFDICRANMGFAAILCAKLSVKSSSVPLGTTCETNPNRSLASTAEMLCPVNSISLARRDPISSWCAKYSTPHTPIATTGS